MHCQWPVLLPFDVDDPKLLPLCIGCGLRADVLLHVELSVPGPHPDFVGGAADGLGVDVLHVELSVPGPHPDVGVDCGLLVVLHVELSVPGPHPGSVSAAADGGGVPPVLLLGIVALPIVPGGTLIMLPGGSVPVLLPVGGAFVRFPLGLNTPPFSTFNPPGVTVEGGS